MTNIYNYSSNKTKNIRLYLHENQHNKKCQINVRLSFGLKVRFYYTFVLASATKDTHEETMKPKYVLFLVCCSISLILFCTVLSNKDFAKTTTDILTENVEALASSSSEETSPIGNGPYYICAGHGNYTCPMYLEQVAGVFTYPYPPTTVTKKSITFEYLVERLKEQYPEGPVVVIEGENVDIIVEKQ